MDTFEVVIRQPGFPDRVIPLQEGRMRLGRADDNEIVLSDVGVSRRHAQIVLASGEVTIEDLGSGNGTYYFGHRVKSQVMRDQDEVVIDPFVLQFQIKGGPTAIAPPALPDLPPPDQPRIEVVVGNGMVGTNFPIVDGRLTIGRAEDRDVVVPDAASSRHHCQITLQGSEYVLHDNGSANGVFVNAVRVRECTLSNGDLIRIGNTEMRFVHPAASQAPTRDLGDPSAWAQEASNAGAIPISSPQPEPPPVRRPSREDEEEDEEEEESGGTNTVVVGAALASVLVLAGLALFLVVIIAGGVWYMTAGPVQVATVAERPPSWTLELPALPAKSDQELIDEGTRAAAQADYRGTLEALYRVLQARPGDATAKKFSAFAGEMLVIETLEAELAERLAVESRRAARRDRLLRQLEDVAKSRRGPILRELESDYREDPVVREHSARNSDLYRNGEWSLTNEQQSQKSALDKMRREVEIEQYSKASRTGRRLLEETKMVDLRIATLEQLDIAESALAKQVAKAWRTGVMDEALGQKDDAIKAYTQMLLVDENNKSAELRLEALKGRP
ncbi:MAG: FHA domain-containing protein [Myxococcales bacterium]|nr:FHA domain-containing protein [Myxococcales bacterium]MCB9672035.1 FHA domain-containing protein [Alphaproteobacteria bacterium]